MSTSTPSYLQQFHNMYNSVYGSNGISPSANPLSLLKTLTNVNGKATSSLLTGVSNVTGIKNPVSSLFSSALSSPTLAEILVGGAGAVLLVSSFIIAMSNSKTVSTGSQVLTKVATVLPK